MCGISPSREERESAIEQRLSQKERLDDALREIERLRVAANRRHVLSVIEATGMASTSAATGEIFGAPTGPFRLDDQPVEVKWTKAGLRVGCHVITREALSLLARIEE